MVYLARRFFAIYIDGVIIFILANLYYIIGQVLTGVEVSNVKTPDLDNLVLIGIFFIYFGLSEFFLDRH